MPRWQTIPHENWKRAREMRRQPTKAEKILWRALRSHQSGPKFRRQHPIGPYIADFYAPDEKLIIEVDGDSHMVPRSIEHDAARSQYLATLGISVVRFSNYRVKADVNGVVSEIQNILTPLNPPAKAGGDPNRLPAEDHK